MPSLPFPTEARYARTLAKTTIQQADRVLTHRILVTGASVAGNAVAWWLGRYGFDVTVVERTSGFRDGGQNIDVRGVGREVLRRMGLEEQALSQGTGEQGTAWVDRRGRIKALFGLDASGGDGPTAEMEILRGDLARLLFDAAQKQARYRFGETVERVDQDEAGVTVAFSGGGEERFDLLILAEGVGSSTRELVFPGENDPRWMGLTLAYFTIPRTATDDRLWRWYHAPGGRSVSLRPDRHGTTRAMLGLRQPPREGASLRTPAAQTRFLRDRFADAGWEAARVLASLDGTGDYYFDVLRQVRMKRWSNGRVALLGDAAWCVTPLGGLGTTLALTGACVLASELRRAGDVGTALARYEAELRPMVEPAGSIPGFVPRIMNPNSRLGIRILHGVLGLMARPAVRSVADRVFSRPTVEPDLSRYEPLPS